MAALATLAIIVIRTKAVALLQGPRAGLTVIVLAQARQIAVYAAPAIYRHDCYRARDAIYFVYDAVGELAGMDRS